tara:strand:- start:516 stop:1325 length:810 start_codon:yes stop_codon:yes gene_type:complete
MKQPSKQQASIQRQPTIMASQDVTSVLPVTNVTSPVNDGGLPDFIVEVVPFIEDRVKKFHTLFTQPMKAELWEETLHNAFQDIGLSTSWEPIFSHKIGEDMRVKGVTKSRISCKSGILSTDYMIKTVKVLKLQLRERGLKVSGKKSDLVKRLEDDDKKNGIVTSSSVRFSGSRSSSYPTLDEKLAHFCKSNDDWYFLLSKPKDFQKKYTLLVFQSSVCKVDQLNWVENGKGWKGTGEFNASITAATASGQLWIDELPLNKIPYKFLIKG